MALEFLTLIRKFNYGAYIAINYVHKSHFLNDTVRFVRLPENFSAEAKWISCEEPSENVVLSISKIVQRMIGGRAEFKKNAQNEEELSDLCEPKCLCGKVINVVIWEAVHWDLMIDRGDGISFVKVGQCIRLRNAIAKMEGSISCKFSRSCSRFFNCQIQNIMLSFASSHQITAHGYFFT